MIINDVEFNAECIDIVTELQNQLRLNNIPLLGKVIDTTNNVQVCCPYHNERRPSAGIRKSDGIFHCFACGEVHTLPELISYCFGKDDAIGVWGWQWLIRNFATIAIEERKDVELDFGRSSLNFRFTSNDESDCRLDNGNDVQCVSEEELDKYRYYHPYWRQRGIEDEHIIELFDLGYDKETDCITMPVRDSKGTTVFVARRSVKTKYFNYPKDVSKPLYGLYEYNITCQRLIDEYRSKRNGKTYLLKRLSEVFICESMIDALLLWQSGYFAFALNGLGSSSQIRKLKELPIRKYILCTDNDSAGEKARAMLKEALQNKLLTEIRFPQNRKDVGECTRDEIDNILQCEVI